MKVTKVIKAQSRTNTTRTPNIKVN